MRISHSLMTYSVGSFSTTVNVRYVDSGKLNILRIGPDDPNYSPTLLNSISDNTVDAATYVSLAMTYGIDVGDRTELEVFGVINNLLDKDPPIAPGGGGGGGSSYPTNPAYFDTLGAQYRAGLRLKF